MLCYKKIFLHDLVFNVRKFFWLCLETCTAWKVSVFGVILVRILPHLDQTNSEYGRFLRSDDS